MEDSAGLAAAALINQTFVPSTVTVEAPDVGRDGRVKLHQFIAPLRPGAFLYDLAAEFAPDMAIQVGEALAAEGRRVRSGLVVASVVEAGAGS